MLRILLAISVFSLFACNRSSDPIVEETYADSVIAHFPANHVVDDNLAFWKKRMDSLPDNFVNGPEYASALLASFRQHGDILDLVKADSLIEKCNEANQGKEPGIWRNQASVAMLRHQFAKPDSFLKRAVAIEGNSFPNAFLDFDISFERGQYYHAKALLYPLKAGNEFGYLFRRSKFEHYNGSLDSAIACMTRAADRADNDIYLKQAALSNAADLYIHKGDLQKAFDFYNQSLKINPTDLHSLIGLGWIALVHDKNDLLAEKIFLFVKQKTKSPDVLLKLSQLEASRGNTAKQKEYASQFASIVTANEYGKMYTKYLIDLYTGILNEPQKAVLLAQQDVNDRPTPQTYAGYVWSLYCNKEVDQAMHLYKGFVSGKPLEGPELFYMGKMMQGLQKDFNAHQYFAAAEKNRYDLDPVRQKELDSIL